MTTPPPTSSCPPCPPQQGDSSPPPLVLHTRRSKKKRRRRQQHQQHNKSAEETSDEEEDDDGRDRDLDDRVGSAFFGGDRVPPFFSGGNNNGGGGLFTFGGATRKTTTLTSVLSPRRSSRLLEKHLKEGIHNLNKKEEEQGTQQGHSQVESTSDYGTLSNVTTASSHHHKRPSSQPLPQFTLYNPPSSTLPPMTQFPPLMDASLALSDDLSILSIDDDNPHHQFSENQHHSGCDVSVGKLENTHHTHYTQDSTHSDDGYNVSYHLLIPNNNLYNFRRHRPQISVTPTFLPTPTFQDLTGLPQSDHVVLKVQSNNYNYNTIHKPVISVSFPWESDYCLIFLISPQKLVSKEPIKNNHVTFDIVQDGDYLLIPRKKPWKLSKVIIPEEETVIEVVDLVRITFPRNCVKYQLLVQLEIYHHGYLECGCFHSTALAAPVLVLSPNSVTFQHPVVFEVIVPSYNEISKYATLQVLQHKRDASDVIHVPFSVMATGGGTNSNTVQFTVTTFSYFTLLWTTVTSTLSKARHGLSRLLSQQQTLMKCQATIDEFDNDKFGLEVSVYSATKSFPEIQNYSHIVGKAVSKYVKHGTLCIGLKGSKFEADYEAGEDNTLLKYEEFWGQDFSVQFALKFKKKGDKGPFGKVFVKMDAILFEFNVQKRGGEHTVALEENSGVGMEKKKWNTVALQELGANLFVTDPPHWKLFARRCGFTKAEIKTKFKQSPDPFRTIIETFHSRGGEPEEFINVLYEVHREIRNLNGGSNESLASSSGGVGRRSISSSGLGSSLNSKNNKPFRRFESESSSSDDNNDNGSDKDHKVEVSPKVSLPTSSIKNSKKRKNKTPKIVKKKKRRKRKEATTTESEDDDEDDEDESSSCSSENRRNRSSKLSHTIKSSSDQLRSSPLLLTSDSSLWDFSTHLTNSSWKALGRTLQLEESILVNIEQNHKSSGNRECYYQVLLSWKEAHPKKCTFGNLYQALCKENMVAVAKKMTKVFTHEDEDFR